LLYRKLGLFEIGGHPGDWDVNQILDNMKDYLTGCVNLEKLKILHRMKTDVPTEHYRDFDETLSMIILPTFLSRRNLGVPKLHRLILKLEQHEDGPLGTFYDTFRFSFEIGPPKTGPALLAQ
jgi:hypothetical protein